jgi:hypothetical protein
MEERKLLAPSWDAYLDTLAGEMEAGGLTYSEDMGVVRA